MYYLVNGETGQIRLRGTGSMRPKDGEVLIEHKERFHPKRHIYSFKTKAFVKVPKAAIAAQKRESQAKVQEELDKANEFAAVLSGQSEDIQRLIALMLELPNDMLVNAVNSVNGEQKVAKKAAKVVKKAAKSSKKKAKKKGGEE
jgi:hypothetical protein